MDTSVLPPEKWGMIFILLSLDVMSPLYEPMGLQLRDKELFQRRLRSLILDNRKTYEQNPESIPLLADRVFGMLESEFGGDEAEAFYRWSTNTFNEVHADLPQWSSWEILFFRFAYNAKLRDALLLPPDKRNAILEQYCQDTDVKEMEESIGELKSRPLSDWDLEMYAIHQFDNDDVSDPFEIVLRVIRTNRFQIFWEEAIFLLSTEEKIKMWRQGQDLLKEMGVWMPEGEGLRYPDNLRR